MPADPELLHLRPAAEAMKQLMPGSLLPALESPADLEAFRQFEWPDEQTVIPAVTRDVKLDGRQVSVRIFRPENPSAIYLDIHGGGWCTGWAKMHDKPNAMLAVEANVCVVSVDYRLAPEHPYPAGPDDCELAARWVVERGRAEFGTDQLFIGGESAGANLAVATFLRLQAAGLADRVAGLVLLYGAYDLNGTPSQLLYEDEVIISRSDIVRLAGHYLGEATFEQRRAPDVSPLYARLQHVPPALFLVGEDDPLLDDSLFMAARWTDSGAESEMHLFPSAPHGFANFPGPLADAAESMIQAWIRQRAQS